MLSGLILIPLPIGNPGDLSPRAAELLTQVDLILAEDTRVAGLQLQELKSRASFLSYHAHNEQQRNAEVLKLLRQGKSVALVSDAGMPVISDPGASLVKLVIQENLPLTALPGPNAALTALIASGLSAERFAFEGFLGKKDGEIRARLSALINEERSLIFYEAPHRLSRVLELLLKGGFAERKLCLARELTKRHEEYLRGTVAELASLMQSREARGEYVLVLEGQAEFRERCPELAAAESEADLVLAMREGLAAGRGIKELSKDLADLFKQPARKIYQELLALKNEAKD